MTEKSIVSVIKTRPESVLDDIAEAMDQARFRDFLDPSATVIPERQHFVALPLSQRQYHSVADGGRDTGSEGRGLPRYCLRAE